MVAIKFFRRGILISKCNNRSLGFLWRGVVPFFIGTSWVNLAHFSFFLVYGRGILPVNWILEVTPEVFLFPRVWRPLLRLFLRVVCPSIVRRS